MNSVTHHHHAVTHACRRLPATAWAGASKQPLPHDAPAEGEVAADLGPPAAVALGRQPAISQPASQPTSSHRSANQQWGGRRQGAKPLGFAAPPKGSRAC